MSDTPLSALLGANGGDSPLAMLLMQMLLGNPNFASFAQPMPRQTIDPRQFIEPPPATWGAIRMNGAY